MSCRFAHDDAAYVMGALAPAERLEFERHLTTCEECTRSVRELAGLPGLLGRVDASVLEQPVAADPPVPSTLMPSLAQAVHDRRRRRRWVSAGIAAAVLTVAAVSVPVVLGRSGPDEGQPRADVPSSVVDRRMSPVGDVPVEATMGMEDVAWGTRLLLTCTYEPRSVGYDLPAGARYDLVVRTRAGATEKVGSWRSVSGATMKVAAATAAEPDEIASVEVRTTDGRVVLRLRA